MANSFIYKDKQQLAIGSTVTLSYKIKEGDKERVQDFQGIIIQIRGQKENKMFTVRKISKSGIGVERVFPLESPYIAAIKLNKTSKFRKAKAYFIRGLSQQKLREKLYRNTKQDKQ